jgi:hypothetical protein
MTFGDAILHRRKSQRKNYSGLVAAFYLMNRRRAVAFKASVSGHQRRYK